MQNRTLRFILPILLLVPFQIHGQKLVNSPIARYNIGILEPAGSFRSLGMGGISVALRDNSSIHFNNPASYSAFDTLSFLFDFGIDYSINVISDGTSSDQSDDLNFDHLLMGFPITKRWGFATGIIPVSNGYYNVSEQFRQGVDGYDDPLTGDYTAYHGGSGGFSTFFLGTGLNITKKISAGINFSAFFGSLRRYNEFTFADYIYTFQTNITEKYSMTGLGLDYGLQYSTNLKKDLFFNAGISYSSGKRCKTNYENIKFRYNAVSATDTIDRIADDSTRAFLPGTFRAGIAFGKKNKFTAGIDYAFTGWENADFLQSTGNTVNSHTVTVGLEYTPDRFSNFSFLKRIDYRLGGHIGNNYLLLKDEKVNEIGVSFGTGIPLRLTRTKTNFFIDYTRRSCTTSVFTHYENYITMGISLNIFDFWFIKPKWD